MTPRPASQTLPLSQIRPSPNAAKHYTDEQVKALADNIKLHGLLNPIAVCPSGTGDKGQAVFEVIAGERRRRAMLLNGETTIDVRVFPADLPLAERRYIALVEDIARVEINPIEEARGYRVLIDTYDQTQSDIALQVGKTQGAVSQALALLDLPVEIQEFITGVIISPRHARELARIPRKDSMIRIAGQCIAQKWSAEKLAEEVTAFLGAKETSKPKKPATYADLVDPLAEVWTRLRTQVPGDWGIHFVKRGRWTLTSDVPSATRDPKAVAQALAQTWRALADALEQAEAPKPVPTAIEKVTDELLAHPDDQEDDIDKIRTPKTPAEMAELRARAEKGPEAVYLWLYGDHSTLAKSMKGTTWKDLGFADAEKGLATLLEGVRMAKRK